ncbi:MAG: family 78 glycoside hydrolase catalytic domain [Bacteroidales bacterium]|nr:family 78 glycoside hydrolase catalytic domain [Bacteroidales bacterium]
MNSSKLRYGIFILIMITLIAFIITYCSFRENISVNGLRCEYLFNPEGIDKKCPRFSWILQSGGFNKSQQAYQIFVSSSGKKLKRNIPDIWNSGKINGNETNQVKYAGSLLKSGKKYYWKVRIWDERGMQSAWSKAAYFSMGLLKEKDWIARWIGIPAYNECEPDSVLYPSPMFRKQFIAKKPIKRATLFFTSLGDYEVFINGKKSGENILAPEWTAFDKRVQYQTYDVTSYIEKGVNVIAAWLGDGWYAGCLGPVEWKNDYPYYPYRGYYGHDLRLRAQLILEYKTGGNDTIISGPDWLYYNDGPIRSSDNFLGEVYDSRKELPGWKLKGYNCEGWENVIIDTTITTSLTAQMNEPIIIIDSLAPINVRQPGPDTYVFDLGQNMVGWCKVLLQGRSGTEIILKHGEMLNDNGTVYTENLKTAIQTDKYILDGKGETYLSPHFTYHGFRYVQVEGLAKKPDINDLKGMVISSSSPRVGYYKFNNSLLDKLTSNILWTQRGNMHSVPTDCPQRSERMGWMGDAQIFSQTAIYNLDMAAFFSKWIKDIRDGQYTTGEYSDVNPRAMPETDKFVNAPGWADAGIIIPWKMYLNYNDTTILREHYESMKRYINRIPETNPDLIYDSLAAWSYGDWLNGDAIISDDYPDSGASIPDDVYCTAFFAQSVKILSDIASILNSESDRAKYEKLYSSIREKFNEEFVAPDGTIKGNTQAGYAIALNFGLLDEEISCKAFDKLIKALEEYDGRMSTGFISTVCLLKELSKRGRHDLACSLVESHRLPSWGYSIDQGATTIWERWDGYVKGRGFQHPGMNSFNHYAFGSVGEWMVGDLIGFKTDISAPGYRHFIIEPRPGGSIKHVQAKFRSINGTIYIEWLKNTRYFNLKVDIPVNTSANIILPGQDLGWEQVKINNKEPDSFEFIRFSMHDGSLLMKVPSGKYYIYCTNKN